MVDASGLSGICRSNTGVADTDEPCTNSIVPGAGSRAAVAAGLANCLRHMKSLTLSVSARLTVQCALPLTSARAPAPARTSSGRNETPAHAAAAVTRNSRREPPTSPLDTLLRTGVVRKLRSTAGGRHAVCHLGIFTRVTALTRLLASTKSPSRVTDVLRTMLPPPGIAQLWNLEVLGSKRTIVFGVVPDSLYQMMSLMAEMP